MMKLDIVCLVYAKSERFKRIFVSKSMPLNLALRNQMKPVQATQRMRSRKEVLRYLLMKEECIAVAVQISSGKASNPSAETILCACGHTLEYLFFPELHV